MTTAKERYRNDPVFRRLVDVLRSVLRDNQATPSELREALMLAVYCEEMERPSPVFFRLDQLGRDLAADVLSERARVALGVEADPCRHCIAWQNEAAVEPCPVHVGMWCAKHRTAEHVEGSVVCVSKVGLPHGR